MSACIIHPDSLATFQRLPLEVQDDANRWMPWLARLLSAQRTDREQLVQAAAADLRVSPKTVRKRLTNARKSSPRQLWRACVNGRKLGTANTAVPSDFIPFWQGLVLENKRCTKPAYDLLVSLWRGGEPIPGFPAAVRPYDMPAGLSYRNLIRKKYMPGEARLDLARHGVAAARAHLPHVLQDVSEVRPLEYIIFDDVELDFLILVPGCPTPVKLRLIVAMDLCTRLILGYGVRPAVPRPDGKDDGLKLRDMKAVVARLLRTWGVPVDYQMHFICERGTATLPDATKAALAEISAGQITVHDTSMIVGRVFEFRDKSTGNSWGKAWLESFFNILHNRLANVPGQKGRRYDLAPAELEGRRRELAQLVRAGKRLPIESRLLFKYPFLNCAEALQELDLALAKLHTRHDHELQGFDQVATWRLKPEDEPRPAHELPDWLIGHSDQLLWGSRMESPMERWSRKIGDVQRREIHPSGLQRLMDEQARVRFSDLSFSFQYKGTDYTYLVDDALLPVLEENQHYLLWFHPHDMQHLYITRDRPHLGYVGKLSRFQTVKKGDLNDAKDKLRTTQHIFQRELQATQERGINRILRHAEEMELNAEILNTARTNAAALETEHDVIAPHASVPSVPFVPSTGDQAITADIETRRVEAQAQADHNAATRQRATRVSRADLDDLLTPAQAPAAADPESDTDLSDLL